MRYFIRIFLSIVFTIGLGFAGYGYWLMEEIKNQRIITTEDVLADTAGYLASVLSKDMKKGKININNIDVKAMAPQTNAYITDESGVVIYDSASKDNIGRDSSQMREVHLTLQGKYGTRSSPTDANDPFSQEFYVAAPIELNQRIVGVVSVSRSVKSILTTTLLGQDRIIWMINAIFFGAIALAILFSYWLARPINELIEYAQAVARGENARPPKTSLRDFRNLGNAFENMRVSLEKKESVKNYVNDLTHALKSPLTAVKATAELLENEVPQNKKHLFLNIELEADRANKLLNDLLKIAQLEARVGLSKKEKLFIKELIEESLQSLESIIKKKKINIVVNWGSSKPIVKGDRFLILQIFENIILNAIEFSPIEGKIIIESVADKKTDHIFVRDQGPGIPEYAKEKIFNKFYSLERPSGKKSSGLGLSFVMEALSFHNGMIQLEPSSQEMSGANFKVSFSKS